MYRNSSYCTWNSHKWPNSEIFSPHYVADATVELTYLLGFTIIHFYEALPPETPHLPAKARRYGGRYAYVRARVHGLYVHKNPAQLVISRLFLREGATYMARGT